MAQIKIRPVESGDFPAWLPLWDGNNLGQRNEAVTTETWTRLVDPDFPVHGLVAESPDGALAGLVHYILHYTTGAVAPVCYMQDLYVSPEHRRHGIGRRLVRALADQGQKEKWARLYWLAEADNKAAQALYKDFGIKLDFTLHVLRTG